MLAAGSPVHSWRGGMPLSFSWYTDGVLRHPDARRGQRFAPHLANRTFSGLLAGNGASVKCLTYAPDGASAAGLRFCRASVIRPHAATSSFRVSCKPPASAVGQMTRSEPMTKLPRLIACGQD